jgi:hypothetical protein
MKYLVAILAFAIGAAGMVAGEADDSPGLQLLGVVLVVGAAALGVRIAQRSRWHVQSPALSPRAQAGLYFFLWHMRTRCILHDSRLGHQRWPPAIRPGHAVRRASGRLQSMSLEVISAVARRGRRGYRPR